jgi:hypothetical protein
MMQERRAMRYTTVLLAAVFFLSLASIAGAQAQGRRTGSSDLAVFEREAQFAKELGATHMVISDDIPPGLWQFDPPNDPYPAWYVYRVSVLKLFPPKELEPFVDKPYADQVVKLLEDRCAILRKHGLKAQWNSSEPQVLPEAFFAAHPELRGPRTDQPNRSRIARFSPCVDEPGTLELYRQAMRSLLRRLPEVDTFNFLTQDSGSGFCWTPSLYPGINGPAHCKDRPMEQRIAGFLTNVQKAAKEDGRDIAINLNPITPRQWMIPSFSPQVLEAIIHALPRGLSVQGREGPDGRPSGIGGGGEGGGATLGVFYPVVGIFAPNVLGAAPRAGRAAALFDDELTSTSQPTTAPLRRVLVSLGDPSTFDFNFRFQKAQRAANARNMAERVAAVRAFAVAEVGEPQADSLLTVWNDLNEVSRGLNALDFGGMLRFGHVLNRWVTRPMVPFPKELTPGETRDYRAYLFQAKDELQASNLIDIQAMRMYEGWGAKMLFQRVVEINAPLMRDALTRVNRLRDAAQSDEARKQWDLYGRRIEAALILIHSADNMVSYQAHLDRLKQIGAKPEINPPLGVQSDWARTDMIELARKEIDNAIRLRQIIQGSSDPILDLGEPETIMRLGPTIADQLKHKIDVMNAHWGDYDRLFSVPNP